jgi:thiol reductant ABC exporter CydD subunit
MRPGELLRSDRSASRVFTFAVIAAIAAAIVLVAWTLVLARTIVSVPFEAHGFGGFAAALIGLLVLRAALTGTSATLSQTASTRVRAALRSRLFGDIVNRDRVSLIEDRVGDDTNLIGNGIDALDAYITSYLPARLVAVVVPVAVFIVIAVLDPWSALVLAFAGPMLIALLSVIGRRTRTLADRRFRELGWLRSFHLDMVRGIPTLKIFGRAEESVGTIEELSSRFSRTTMDVLRTAFQTSLVIEWAATAATALVAVQISLRMVDGKVAFSTALAVLMLTPEFFVPLRQLAIEYHAGQTGNAVLERLTTSSARHDASTRRTRDHRPATDPPGTVAFDSVSYRYPDDDRLVLDSITFTIDPGETVAVTGPSGAGKSTIAALLLALMDPTGGCITIDGVDLSDLEPDAWRRSVTWVAQAPAIFSGSISDNIRLSDPDASTARVRAAIEMAGADEFVDALPLGAATVLGENGLRLSGGQRQRLAIARAALRDAPFVVFDEFTAHLDPTTERDIVDAMRRITDGRTTLIIAHRGATLSLADRVFVLDGDLRAGIRP